MANPEAYASKNGRKEMNTKCPHCGKFYEVDEAYKGQNTDCIYCGKIFTVQETNAMNGVPLNIFSSSPKGKLSPEARNDFKTPILAVIFDSIAVLCLGSAVLFLIIGLIALIQNGLESSVPVLLVSLSSIGAAVVNFGIAQIMTCVAKTAYNTDKIVELLKNRVK